jgi:hypothetical protein
MRKEEETCFRQFMRLGTFLLKIQDRKSAGNEGSTGHVDENTEGDKMDTVPYCFEPVAGGASDEPHVGPRQASGVERNLRWQISRREISDRRSPIENRNSKSENQHTDAANRQ